MCFSLVAMCVCVCVCVLIMIQKRHELWYIYIWCVNIVLFVFAE